MGRLLPAHRLVDIMEGIGAALVLPALVALIAGSCTGSNRAIAYGVIGGVAGAGILAAAESDEVAADAG
ncbi:MAG: hypothetical protein WBM90_07240 [Acidimicrobiia bacterium]